MDKLVDTWDRIIAAVEPIGDWVALQSYIGPVPR